MITPQELQQVKDRLNPVKENKVLVEFVFKDGNTKRDLLKGWEEYILGKNINQCCLP